MEVSGEGGWLDWRGGRGVWEGARPDGRGGRGAKVVTWAWVLEKNGGGELRGGERWEGGRGGRTDWSGSGVGGCGGGGEGCWWRGGGVGWDGWRGTIGEEGMEAEGGVDTWMVGEKVWVVA